MKLITMLTLLIVIGATEAIAVAPTLVFSTYLGGNDYDELLGMAVDSSGNVYVMGNTNSLADFPTTPGAYRRTGGGPYVTKMNSTGTALIYSTFIGPGASKAMAVDAAGNVFITGQANAGFPTTPGAYRTSIPGVTGGIFVAKLDATGSNLIYSTLIGIGTVRGLAIDADGNAYITGTAGTDYPITQGAFQTTSTCAQFSFPCSDAFVTKLNATGSALVYSTYLGGDRVEHGNDIAVDAAGNAFVTGQTESFNFPTVKPFQAKKGGSCTGDPGEFPCGPDAFVSRLNAQGSALIYSSYLGGSNVIQNSGGPGTEGGTAIAVDALGSAYVTGYTDSGSFPTTPNAFQRSASGGFIVRLTDAFAVKVSPAGSLAYGSYLGGFGNDDVGGDITADADGNIVVVGRSKSNMFPRVNALPITNGIGAFVSVLNPFSGGASLSTLLGLGIDEICHGVGIDGVGNIYAAGDTPSFFPVTMGAFQTQRPLGTNGFLVKLAPDLTGMTLANASAASYSRLAIAPDSITAAFGSGLATTSLSAPALPLPTLLGGTMVKIKDSAGVEASAPLFFVSPTQVNYLVPPQTAEGVAQITITAGDGKTASGNAQVQKIAPGLFSANMTGQGVAAAVALRYKADGSSSYEPVVQFDVMQNKFVSLPIDLGPETDQVYLLLFGTGISGRSSSSAVTVGIGGVNAPVSFAGAQGEFVGLDQINVLLPRTLIARGEVKVTLVVDGYTSNIVLVRTK